MRNSPAKYSFEPAQGEGKFDRKENKLLDRVFQVVEARTSDPEYLCKFPTKTKTKNI